MEAAMKPFYEKQKLELNIIDACDLRFPEHLHESVELLLVTGGEIEVNIMGKSKRLTAGDCAVIFPGLVHSYRRDSNNSLILLIFDPSFTGTYSHAIQQQMPADPFVPATALPADAVLSVHRLHELFFCGKLNGQDVSAADLPSLESAWFQLLFALLLPFLHLQERNSTEDPGLVYQLIQYIYEHFQEPLTLDYLAQELHVSKYYLSHIFSDHLQMNFRQYLNHFRLDYARQLLQTTNYSVTRVWEESGFNSQCSFNRAFLDHVGKTPLAYRRSVT